MRSVTMAKLIGMSGEFKGREFPLESNGETTIGRKSDNVLPVDDPTISSHHCLISGSESGLTLEDLGSTNGTRLNSRDVKDAPVQLHHKDLILLGSVEFMVEAPELGEGGARYTDASEEGAAELAAPADFATISPFGAPPKEKMGAWVALLILVGVLTLGALGWLGWTLATT